MGAGGEGREAEGERERVSLNKKESLVCNRKGKVDAQNVLVQSVKESYN